MKALAATAIAAALAAAPAFAVEEHRELGPHVHGHGTLNIAVEATRVSMELEVPGMDIVGFEHAAESADQKAAVDTATKELADPLMLFKVPAAAGCKTAEAKVAVESEHEHEHEHEQGAADHDHDEHEGHAGHNEFHVTYTLECAKPGELTSIAFEYFKAFAGAHDLTVNVVTAKAQNSYEVSRDKPVLDLGGTM
jgi:hypothetical protein